MSILAVRQQPAAGGWTPCAPIPARAWRISRSGRADHVRPRARPLTRWTSTRSLNIQTRHISIGSSMSGEVVDFSRTPACRTSSLCVELRPQRTGPQEEPEAAQAPRAVPEHADRLPGGFRSAAGFGGSPSWTTCPHDGRDATASRPRRDRGRRRSDLSRCRRRRAPPMTPARTALPAAAATAAATAGPSWRSGRPMRWPTPATAARRPVA